MIRYTILLFSALLLTAPLCSQIAVTETASSFVNFNLNRINKVRAYYPQYRGQGMVASVKEFRYDTLDIDFQGRHIPYLLASGAPTPHATLMATILAGAGNSDRTGRGVAPSARLTSASFLNLFPDNNTHFEELQISVQNHSYGIDSIENFYSPIAAAYDLQVSRLPELLHVFSIGNLGATTPNTGPYAGIPGYANMTGTFKLAKNVLTMGVVDSFGVIDPFSSHGPAFDGRIKPELVAFGIDGSSAAAALASGSALLLQQAYRERHGRLPAAALVKALLINGATDLGTPGIDHIHGFGSIDLYHSMETLLAGRYLSDTLDFEQTNIHRIDIPEGVATLKITLVWTDPPAPVNAQQALVNDLDLVLEDPIAGTLWRPQLLSIFPQLDSLRRPAQTGADHINNIEQIVVQNPSAGRYEMHIRAFDFQVAEQAYELVFDWETQTPFRWAFPSKDDQVIPSANFTEQIYWDAPTITAAGNLSYSFDGDTWNLIDDAVDLSRGYATWSPPDTIARALLRMRTGEKDFISDTFMIATQPFLDVVLNCQDSVGIAWSPKAGIQQYQLYTLGAQYLEPYLLTTDTFITIPRRQLDRPYVAYAPVLPDGAEAVRSRAYNLDQFVTDCYVQRFTGNISGTTATLQLSLSTTYSLQSLTVERLEQGNFIDRQTTVVGASTQYTFTENDLRVGANQYRIRLLLRDGSILFSPILSLNYIQSDRFLIYPNPISRAGGFSVRYNVEQPEEVFFHLYTVLGAQVLSLSLPELTTVLFADDLQSGLYFYQFVRRGELLQSGKLVVR